MCANTCFLVKMFAVEKIQHLHACGCKVITSLELHVLTTGFLAPIQQWSATLQRSSPPQRQDVVNIGMYPLASQATTFTCLYSCLAIGEGWTRYRYKARTIWSIISFIAWDDIEQPIRPCPGALPHCLAPLPRPAGPIKRCKPNQLEPELWTTRPSLIDTANAAHEWPPVQSHFCRTPGLERIQYDPNAEFPACFQASLSCAFSKKVHSEIEPSTMCDMI